MSHSVVMVDLGPTVYGASYEEINERLEKKLSPYDENAQVAKYKDRINPDTAWDGPKYAADVSTKPEHENDRKKFEARGITFPVDFSNPQQELLWYNRYGGADDEEMTYRDSEGLYRWSTYNPLSRWDWWALGGRWSGMLRIKHERDPFVKTDIDTGREESHQRIVAMVGGGSGPRPGYDKEIHQTAAVIEGKETWAALGDPGTGGRSDRPEITEADVARKMDIDIEMMRGVRIEERRKVWQRWIERLAKRTEMPVRDVEDWAALQAGVRPDAMNTWRWEYLQKKVAEIGITTVEQYQTWQSTMWELDEESWRPGMTEEQYAHAQDDSFPIHSFAILTEAGEWLEKGKMGWWGSVGDPKDEDDWVTQWQAWWDDMPDDHVIAVVDVHI